MNTLLLFILFLSQNAFFSFNELVQLTKKNEDGIANILINKNYLLNNRKSQNDGSFIQFTNNDKKFPSINIFFSDPDFQKVDYCELILSSDNQNDNLRLENIIKNNCIKGKTFYNQRVSNYITKYSCKEVDIYYYSFLNINKTKVINLTFCKSGQKLNWINNN